MASRIKYTVEMFINDANRIHKNKYDYSKVKEFKTKKDKVPIVCPIHGEFHQQVGGHLKGYECKKCGFEKTKKNSIISFDTFVKKAREKYGDKFTYHKDTYSGIRTNTKITCPIHGDFIQAPYVHIADYTLFGCKKCGHDLGLSKAVTKEKFIERANQKFNNKFSFDKMNYKDFNTKVIITCPIHGDFETTPLYFINTTYGCAECSVLGRAETSKVSFEEFVNKAKAKHNDRYTYHKDSYDGITSDTRITCPIHGDFMQEAYNHAVMGHGCAKCSGKHQYTTEEWVDRAISIRGHRYDYSKVKYIDKYTPVTIICAKHGEFKQNPDAHINRKANCPKCSASMPERIIINWLDENDIKYVYQYMFPSIDSKLRYDFYLTELNILIEYDGSQHFNSISLYESTFNPDAHNGMTYLEYTKSNDKKKEEIARSLNVPLVRITYKDNDIIAKLKYLISKYYKYRVNDKFYKTFTDFCKGQQLPLDTTPVDVKKYLTHKPN